MDLFWDRESAAEYATSGGMKKQISIGEVSMTSEHELSGKKSEKYSVQCLCLAQCTMTMTFQNF